MTDFEVLKDVFIATDNPSVEGRTEFKDDEDGILVIGNKYGIHVRSPEGAYYGGDLTIAWADVLKHVPAHLMIEELESTGCTVISETDCFLQRDRQYD